MEFQKTAEKTGDLIGNKIANTVQSKIIATRANLTTVKLRESQEIHHGIIQKQLQLNMIKKYLKKDIHFRKKYSKKLLVI